MYKRRIKNTIQTFLCLLTALFVLPFTVYGAEIEITNSVENKSKSGVVDISLEQYYLVEGELEKEPSDRMVLPGEEYSLIPIIRNEGSDCYVRVKVDFNNISGGADMSNEHIIGLYDDWIVVEDYIYYTEVLPHGDSLQVFDGIQLPHGVGKEYAGADIEVKLLAEAIQSSGFQPDFQSDAPWGDFQSEKSKDKEYDYEGMMSTHSGVISVAYKGDAEKLVLTPDDFFAGFDAMLPGQIYQDEVDICNDSDQKMELFIKIEPHSSVVLEEAMLMTQMYIRIEKADAFGNHMYLYEGKYMDEQLWEYMSVGTYSEGENGKLVFSIYLPAELTNQYSLLEETSIWTFMTKSQQKETEKQSQDDQSESLKEEPTIVDRIVQRDAAKTGDSAPIYLLFLLVMVALFVIAVVAVAGNRKWRR